MSASDHLSDEHFRDEGRKVPHHLLSPSQFVVHDDIVNNKIWHIFQGERPRVYVIPHRNGRYTIEDGHHTAAAYEAMGLKVPVSVYHEIEENDPENEWDDLHHVNDDGPTYGHAKAGENGWGY